MVGGLAWLNALYAYLAWLVALGTSVVATLILVASAVVYPGGYPDPFAPYDALKPGQPASILDNFECMEADYAYGPDGSICEIFPEDGIIQRIYVRTYGNTVRQVKFYSETFQVVDVIRHWGKPYKVTEKRLFFLMRWQEDMLVLAPVNGQRFNYQLPVRFVLISQN